MKSTRRKVSLGELIAALFEESKKVTNDREQQKFLVHVALKDLLRGRVQSVHPILITA
ncbi:MAG TPA: hypothetical protein VLR94_03380 [Acidobacteriota bacterium]|nr:hypothetical protein [Acidobacteriota bacterium]